MAKMNIENLTCLIDLHLHLDGAVCIETVKKLANIQGIDLGLSDDEIIDKYYVKETCNNLDEFLAKFDLPCSLLQTYDAIKLATTDLINNLKNQGVMYAEIRFAPQFLTAKGLSQEDTIKAVLDARVQTGFNCNFILCCIRDINARDKNIETVNLAKKYLGKGVCAIDIAGSESLYGFADFAYIFELAKQNDIPYTIHAGEGAGASSVRKALKFDSFRIGHGVRSCEDDELLKILANKGIILELCPTSNLKTNIYDSIHNYPYKKFIDNNVKVTINSDDPAIELTTIKNEYSLIVNEFNLTNTDLKQLLFNSIDASFTDNENKEKLRQKVIEELS